MFARARINRSHELPEICTARLRLRPLRVADTDVVYAAIDHSRGEFTRWFTWAHDSTVAAVRQSLQEAHLAMLAGTEWQYGIFTRDGEFCGRISLMDINQRARTAELGYWLDIKFHGQGIMTESVQVMLAMILAQTKRLRIDALTDIDNVASQRVLLKCGFRKVGAIHRAVNHPQRGWRDQNKYALVSDGK